MVFAKAVKTLAVSSIENISCSKIKKHHSIITLQRQQSYYVSSFLVSRSWRVNSTDMFCRYSLSNNILRCPSQPHDQPCADWMPMGFHSSWNPRPIIWEIASIITDIVNLAVFQLPLRKFRVVCFALYFLYWSYQQIKEKDWTMTQSCHYYRCQFRHWPRRRKIICRRRSKSHRGCVPGK